MEIVDLVIARIRAALGPPTAESDLACCWHLPGAVDVLVQKDSPAGQANVWLPWRVSDPFLEFAEYFDRDTERPASTHQPACPSLEAGKPAIALPVWRPEDIDQAVAEVRRRAGLSPGPAPKGRPG